MVRCIHHSHVLPPVRSCLLANSRHKLVPFKRQIASSNSAKAGNPQAAWLGHVRPIRSSSAGPVRVCCCHQSRQACTCKPPGHPSASRVLATAPHLTELRPPHCMLGTRASTHKLYSLAMPVLQRWVANTLNPRQLLSHSSSQLAMLWISL